MIRRAGILCLLVVGLSLAGIGSTARAEVTATPRAEFHTRIEELLRALESGETGAVQSAASALSDQATWRSGWRPAAIAIGDEARRLCVDGQKKSDADWLRLEGVCHQLLNETATEPEHDARRERTIEEARKARTGVLAAPEYHDTAGPSWWQRYGIRAFQAVMRWLERIFETHLGQEAGQIAYYLALGILVLPLFLLAGYLIWRALQTRRATITTTTTRAVTALESPGIYWQRAQDLLQRGEFTEALKIFHVALLAGMEARGLVVHDRTRTNWEYLAQFRQNSPTGALVTVFQSLNLMYDRTVFGARSCDAAYVQQFASMTSKLLQDLGGEEITGASRL